MYGLSITGASIHRLNRPAEDGEVQVMVMPVVGLNVSVVVVVMSGFDLC